MSSPSDINPRIMETLYGEALILSDAVRAAFDLPDRLAPQPEENDARRIAHSCEALRTTTRMMHAVAWLLNHRAFLKGELSAFQLRRYGRLSPDFPAADRERLKLLDPGLREMIAETESFYARLLRIDRGWRQQNPAPANPILDMRARLTQAVA